MADASFLDQCFAVDYADARARFRAAAEAAGAAMEAHPCPAPGPGGSTVHMDIARLGPPKADRMLVMVAAIHGVEGFCGSGAMVAWLRTQAAQRPAGVSVLLVHALNPFGFAWLRRVNEDNVDLNRNFVDFGRPLPENPGYAELAPAIVPPVWTADSRAATRARFEDYARRHGERALHFAVAGGQYGHPQGVFFGGRGPTWSRRTLEEVIARHVRGARQVGVIDFHTGLGPYGHGEIICPSAPSEPNYQRCDTWFAGEARSTATGESVSTPRFGNLMIGCEAAMAGSALTYIALEFGTLPMTEVEDAVRADAWLHAHGDPASAQGDAIRRQVRDAFYPQHHDWMAMVHARSRWIIEHMGAGLAAA